VRKQITRAIQAAGMLLVAASTALAQSPVPEGYPADYAELVKKAHEEGIVHLHSNMQTLTWKPILDGFMAKYPGITVEHLGLEDEMFERYLAEKAAGGTPADVMVTSSVGKWVEFANRDELVEYASPEIANIPERARPMPGLFVMAEDAYAIAYNKMLFPEGKQPKSIADIAAYVEANPGAQVATYDPLRVANGHAAWSAWLRHNGDAGWDLVTKIGPNFKGETTASQILDKVMTGEYAIAVNLVGTAVARILEKPGADTILGAELIADGTPVIPRGMGITKAGKHQNAARLFVDYVLSNEGQVALAASYTPVRADVPAEAIKRGRPYASIAEAIGEDQILQASFEEWVFKEYDDFAARWKKAMTGEKN